MRPVDLSAIVPVWETPVEYVKRCIESVVSHRCEGKEIILVDDGNTSQTAEELNRLASAYSGVRVLHKSHAGVSAARNAGLLEASGQYVTFLDADDELVTYTLDEVLEILRLRKPDLLITRIARESEAAVETDADRRTPVFLEDSPELRRSLRIYYTTLQDSRFRSRNTWVNRGPHGRFLTRELALRCPMREDLTFGEDVIWNFDLLNNAERLLVSDLQTYCYWEQSFSATQRAREGFPDELKRLFQCYWMEICQWPKTDSRYYYTAAVEYFTILARLYVFAGDGVDSWRRFEESFRDSMWQEVFSRVDLRTLKGRYRLTGLLGKAGLEKSLYSVMWIHYRLVRRK